MNDNDTISVLLEEFLGRIRIGDIPDIEKFITEHASSDESGELRGILTTLLDVERLAFSSDARYDDPRPPDLASSGYRLMKKIGVGGMGVVYEALQVTLGRRVAIKLLRPELLIDPGIRELFKLEARLIARFNHPGIVRILGTGQCADTFFYVMELVEGKHLDALSQRPSERQILQWAIETADALACAHSHGIIHGDIKPANLLLDKDRHIRICDFGLAFTSQQPSGGKGSQGGTFRYMAPELQCGEIKDFIGDQYALCASLVEIAAARPFDREVDCSRLFRNTQLAAVLNKGLANDPKDRYPSVGELCDDFRRIERHEPVTAGQTSFFVLFGLFCQRHPIYIIATALLTLFLAAVLHGLVRTEKALKLAKSNAATANAVLGKVFDEIVELPPDPENVNLLTQLIPYYEQIAANPNIPPSELTDALTQLAQTAMHAGDYPLAERTLRNLLNVNNSSANMYCLAYTLSQQGKHDESIKIYRNIADRYADGTLQERLDAVGAYLHLIQTDGDHSTDKRSANRILMPCLTANPEDDKALFLYAQLHRLCPEAADESIPDLPTDPLELLDEVSTRNPNVVRYWRAFIDSATDWLNAADATNGCPTTIESARTKSDIMLWRFLNSPHAVMSALSFKRAYARWLQLSGPVRGRAHGMASIDIITRALLNQPDLSEAEQSDLIAFSLDVMEDAPPFPPHRHRPFGPRYRQLKELKDFLEHHQLPRKDEFIRRISALEETIVPRESPASRQNEIKSVIR